MSLALKFHRSTLDDEKKKSNKKLMILGYSYWAYSLMLLFSFIWGNRDLFNRVLDFFDGKYQNAPNIDFGGFVLFLFFSWIGDGLLRYL